MLIEGIAVAGNMVMPDKEELKILKTKTEIF